MSLHPVQNKQQRKRQAETLFDQPLPHDKDAEKLILGVMLLMAGDPESQVVSQAAEILKPADFFFPSNRHVYEGMLRLYEAGIPIDPITVQDDLRKAGTLGAVGGPAHIAGLFDGVPRFSNIEAYVKIVKDKSRLRKVIHVGKAIQDLGFDGEASADEILDKAARMIFEIENAETNGRLMHVGDFASDALTAIEEASGQEDMVTGLRTGFEDLDWMTCGLQPGDYVIIAARPSMGKTALAINIAQNVSMRRRHGQEPGVVAIFSLEMTTPQLVQRMICTESRIDATRLRRGLVNGPEEWKRIAMAVGNISGARMFVDDTPGITTMQLRAKARRLKHEQKQLDLIIVDYLQLMAGSGRSESRQQEVSKISRELKAIAKELGVPLIALSQLSRAPENRSGDKHKPQLSDLRESGSLEQDADVVLAIYREEVYIPETVRQNIADIIILKQRNGPTGTIEVVFLKQITSFEDKYREAA